MNRRYAVSLLACGLATLASAQAAKKAETAHFRVTGTVVNENNGEPIPRARVSAFPTIGPGGPQSPGGGRGGPQMRSQPGPQTIENIEAETDGRGRFSLELPAEGRYRLSVQARNFRMQMFELHEPNFSTAVVVSRTKPSVEMVFRATADARVAGEITDEAGEAVRDAQVRLYTLSADAREDGNPHLQLRTAATTNDLGRYEFPALPAGAYKVSVQAHPWYSTPIPMQPSADGPQSTPLDPSLDVVYPITWFPNSQDESRAELVTLHYGEIREADLRLTPIPSAHITVPVTHGPQTMPNFAQPPPAGVPPQTFVQTRVAQVAMVMADGTIEPARSNMNTMGKTTADIGGLIPGTYRVTEPGTEPDQPGQVSIVRITAEGLVADAGSASADVPLTIAVDGTTSVTPDQIQLIDTATGQIVGRGAIGTFGLRGVMPNGTAGRARREAASKETTVQVPPGTYEVSIGQRADAFLTGLIATGAEVTGAKITIASGTPHLTVHLASGLSTIDGVATFHGAPSQGAMVLLVPASLGDPASLATIRRAQTATDGSFFLAAVIPGPYILLVIDHGWQVNWHDVATLRRYLLQGMPIDLVPAAEVQQTVTAVSP